MTKVVITRYFEGFNKVALTQLLRHNVGYTLSQAKNAVDRLLDGEPITIEVENAIEFCKAVQVLGAACTLDNK